MTLNSTINPIRTYRGSQKKATVVRFLAAEVISTPADFDSWIFTKDLFNRYRDFCSREGYLDQAAETQRSFSLFLKKVLIELEELDVTFDYISGSKLRGISLREPH